MTENISQQDNTDRVEYTRIGFKYIGKALDMLQKNHNEALIILALRQQDTAFREIAKLTGISEGTLNRYLIWLIQNKCIITRDVYGRNIYALTETGKVLANSWVAFLKTTLFSNILPKEQKEAIEKLIGDKPLSAALSIRKIKR